MFFPSVMAVEESGSSWKPWEEYPTVSSTFLHSTVMQIHPHISGCGVSLKSQMPRIGFPEEG